MRSPLRVCLLAVLCGAALLILWVRRGDQRPAGPSAELLFQSAIVKKLRGDLDGALADYNQSIQLQPGYALAYSNRGNLRRERGDLDGSLADCNKALALDPKLASAYVNRGNVYLDRGDSAGALAEYERAIALDPRHAVAYNNRALIRRDAGDLPGALQDFNRAIALDPASAPPYVSRGNLRRQKGDLKAASADFSEAIERDPTAPIAYNYRGSVRRVLGDLEGALADFDRALALDANYTYAYFGRAMVRRDRGDLDGAIADLSHASELAPQNEVPLRNRGLIFSLQARWQQACGDFDAALRVNPRDAYAAYFRYLARTRLGQTAEGAAELRLALDGQKPAKPGDWGWQVGAFLLGDKTEAELLAAAEVEGDFTKTLEQQCEAWFYAGSVHLAAGDKEEAARRFRKSLGTGVKYFTEYQLARAELARLETK